MKTRYHYLNHDKMGYLAERGERIVVIVPESVGEFNQFLHREHNRASCCKIRTVFYNNWHDCVEINF